MKRVRYIMRSAVQRATAPGDVETFTGDVDEVAEVPDEVAAMLAAAGRVEVLAAVNKPTTEQPPPRTAKRRK
jgi:hypothetical protein